MSAEEFNTISLINSLISNDSVLKQKAQESLKELQGEDPSQLLTDVIGIFESSSSDQQKTMSASVARQILREEAYKLNPQIVNEVIGCIIDKVGSSNDKLLTGYASILGWAYSYLLSSENNIEVATSQAESIEGIIKTSLNSTSNLDRYRALSILVAILTESHDSEPPFIKEAFSLVPFFLTSDDYQLALKAYECLVQYVLNFENSFIVGLLKESCDSLLHFISQAPSNDPTGADEVVSSFHNIMITHPKAFKQQVENITQCCLEMIKSTSTNSNRALLSSSLNALTQCTKMISIKKVNLFYNTVQEVVLVFVSQVEEDWFTNDNPDQTKLFNLIVGAIADIIGEYSNRRPDVTQRIYKIAKENVNSASWKLIVAGLMVFIPLYGISQENDKDAEYFKLSLELFSHSSVQVRFTALYLFEAFLENSPEKLIKKNFKTILDKLLFSVKNDPTPIVACSLSCLVTFFNKTKDNKIKCPEEALNAYKKDCFEICISFIKENPSSSKLAMSYACLLAQTCPTNISSEYKACLAEYIEKMLANKDTFSIQQWVCIFPQLIPLIRFSKENLPGELKEQILANLKELTPLDSNSLPNNADDISITDMNIPKLVITAWDSYLNIYQEEALFDFEQSWKDLRHHFEVKFTSKKKTKDNEPNDSIDFEENLVDGEFFTIGYETLVMFDSIIDKVIKLNPENEFGIVLLRDVEAIALETIYIMHWDFDTVMQLEGIYTKLYKWMLTKTEMVNITANRLIEGLATSIEEAFTNNPSNLSGIDGFLVFMTNAIKLHSNPDLAQLGEILNTLGKGHFELCVQYLKQIQDEEKEMNGGDEDEEEESTNNSEEEKDTDSLDSDEDESFDNEDECRGEEEYVWDYMMDLATLWGVIFSRIKGTAKPLLEYITKNITNQWLKKEHYKEKCVAMYSIFAIIEHLNYEDIPPQFWNTTQKLYELSKIENQGTRHNCAYGFGIIGSKFPEMFFKVGDKITERLAEMSTHEKSPNTGLKQYNEYLDNVHSAFGKIFEKNPKFMKDEYVKLWLNYIPLKNCDEEGPLMIGCLCNMLKSEEHVELLLGHKHERLPLLLEKIEECSSSKWCNEENKATLWQLKANLPLV